MACLGHMLRDTAKLKKSQTPNGPLGLNGFQSLHDRDRFAHEGAIIVAQQVDLADAFSFHQVDVCSR
jgi:hypothetical protein